MHDSSISVVIPVYNGRDMLDELVTRLEDVLADFRDHEIILVDDASPDGSFEKIRELAENSEDIKGIAFNGNYGQQTAVLCGLRSADMEYVVIMDDDLEHNPEDIKALYDEITKGFDVVYALNSKKGDNTLVRRFGSWLRDRTFNRLTNKPRDKKVCSFRIITKDIAEKVTAAKTEFVYISMEILKHTASVGNIKVRYGERGRSGHSLSKLIRLMIKLYIYYSGSRMTSKMKKTGEQYTISEKVGKGAV